MTAPRHGEVWWLEDPDIGRRPALVLTRDAAIDVLTRLVVAPITRTVRGIPTEVALDQDDGLPEPCVATFDNVRTVPKVLLTGRVAVLGSERLGEACAALRLALDC